MITPRINCCKECADILPLIDEINCRLYELSLSAYNNIVYSLGLNVNTTMAMDLLNYKRILMYKLVNENYACAFTVNMIASKVKKYVVNCRKNCICQETGVITTTTTSTTVLTTTTTTTTVLTTTTTTT